MPFLNRTAITGVLTTLCPLHIGDGGTTTRPRIVAEDGTKAQIASVSTDVNGRAYLPGTTLKGTLRSWAERNLFGNPLLEPLFGSQQMGGKAEFLDARCVLPLCEQPARLYWDSSRVTCVSSSVAIDRRSHTASPHKLFYSEFVPAGVSFAVRIYGQNLSDEETALLLVALDGFNYHPDPVAVGAQTNGAWGRLSWQRGVVSQIVPAAISAWLQAGANAACPDAALPANRLTQLEACGQTLRASLACSRSEVVIDAELQFAAGFLVNDPSQTLDRASLADRRRRGRAEIGRLTSDRKTEPDHVPIRDAEGRAFLPEASFRGALRSQAEKILRTIGGERAACYPDGQGPRPACGPVHSKRDLVSLCPVCRLFGASGWRSPLHLSDFVQPPGETAAEQLQDFLAVDRFTGGGAPGLKFDAKAAYKPQLRGRLSIDLARLVAAGAGPAELLLVALTLRDLAEGDVALGFGTAKGYGSATASFSIARLPLMDRLPSGLREAFQAAEIRDDDLRQLRDSLRTTDRFQEALIDWFGELHETACAAGR